MSKKIYTFSNGKEGALAGVFLCHELPFVALVDADGSRVGSVSLKTVLKETGLTEAQVRATAAVKTAAKVKTVTATPLREVAKTAAPSYGGSWEAGWKAAAAFLEESGWHKSSVFLRDNLR